MLGHRQCFLAVVPQRDHVRKLLQVVADYIGVILGLKVDAGHTEHLILENFCDLQVRCLQIPANGQIDLIGTELRKKLRVAESAGHFHRDPRKLLSE